MRLFYRETGTGMPLVLLHGLFGSGDNWLSIAQKLVGFRVILPDLRNHGSSPHDNEMNYPVMAADVAQLLDDLGIPEAVIAGHSMGGKTAMELALLHPHRVNALAIFDMAPKNYLPQYGAFIPAMRQLSGQGAHSRGEAQASLERHGIDRPTAQWLLKNLTADPDLKWSWKLGLEELESNYAEIWKGLAKDRAYGGKALFLHGGDSDYLLEEDKKAILDLFPLARFSKIEGAGHWLHVEKGTQFLSEVTSFLKQV